MSIETLISQTGITTMLTITGLFLGYLRWVSPKSPRLNVEYTEVRGFKYRKSGKQKKLCAQTDVSIRNYSAHAVKSLRISVTPEDVQVICPRHSLKLKKEAGECLIEIGSVAAKETFTLTIIAEGDLTIPPPRILQLVTESGLARRSEESTDAVPVETLSLILRRSNSTAS